MSTNRFRLVVAYDGTNFCGWAPQAGLRSVQSTLKEAVRRISGEDCEIVGASRTDAGAHAKAQVCHFDSSVGIPAEKWVRALNDILDEDIAVQKSDFVTERFHSRFSARHRWYRYRIVSGTRNPIKDRFAYWDWREPSIELMNQAAQTLIGRHDFRAYTAELQPWLTNTYRDLKSIRVSKVGEEVRIDIVGTAFMRGMMRRIAGGLFEVGIEKRPTEDLTRLLSEEGMTNIHLPVVLPAKGLMLMKVTYGRRLRDLRTEDEDES